MQEQRKAEQREMKAQIPIIRNATKEEKTKHNVTHATGFAKGRYLEDQGIWLDYEALSNYPKEVTEFVLFHELAHWFYHPCIGYDREQEWEADRFAITMTKALHYPIFNIKPVAEFKKAIALGHIWNELTGGTPAQELLWK
jgi:predicted SprT family Zn-dependent metalloprotease